MNIFKKNWKERKFHITPSIPSRIRIIKTYFIKKFWLESKFIAQYHFVRLNPGYYQEEIALRMISSQNFASFIFLWNLASKILHTKRYLTKKLFDFTFSAFLRAATWRRKNNFEGLFCLTRQRENMLCMCTILCMREI